MYSNDGQQQSLSMNVPAVGGTLQASNLQYLDNNILVSFDLPGVTQHPCIVQAHNWRAALDQPNDFVEIRCPIQNPIPASTGAISYEDNIFTLYPTGNVWGTSRLEQVQAQNTIRRDWDLVRCEIERLYRIFVC